MRPSWTRSGSTGGDALEAVFESHGRHRVTACSGLQRYASTQAPRRLQCPPLSDSPSQLSGAQRGPMAEITNVETGLEGGRTSRALMIPHLLTSLGDVLARCATKLGANPVPKQGGGAGESGPHAGINGCLKKSTRSANATSTLSTKVKIQ